MRDPYRKEIKICEDQIAQIEKEIARENRLLEEASQKGDNSSMIEHSATLGKLQDEVDRLFDRLEIATEKEEEITAEYEEKLAALDG